MKKALILAAIAVIVMAAFLSPTVRTRANALRAVGWTLVTAHRNHAPVAGCAGLVIGANHNVSVITRAADYIVAVGSNTSVFIEIADIAANADRECPRLGEVLELGVRKQSESGRILALARSACRVETAEEVAAWQREFDAVAATAEYPSVEAALSAFEVHDR